MAEKINFYHPLYLAHLDQINRVNNMYDGIDTGKQYLRQYNQEDDLDFVERQDDANLDNFVFSAIDDIKNIIFRKPIDKAGITNAELIDYAKNINFTENLNDFSKRVLTSRLKEGYTFILADSSSYNTEEVQNKAQQQALGIRPYLVNILRSNVLSWKTNSMGQYTQVAIREYYEEELEYSSEIKEQIKVWYDDGMVAIFRDDELFDLKDTGLKVIPIVKIGVDDIPPMYNMAKINITHMNRNSEVDNYTRIGGAAFLAVFGDTSGSAPKTLGINKGIKFSSKQDSDIKWIEMEGTNYKMLESRILYHEEQMNRISASFSDSEQNKTATQVNKESMTSESKLTNYATELEAGINTALEMLNLYKSNGSFGTNTVEVNKDFDSAVLSTEMVKSYKEDYALGIISYEKLIELLIAGEYFKEMTKEEIAVEKARLSDSGM